MRDRSTALKIKTMKEINQLKIQKESHGIKITVYPHIVIAMVILSLDDSYNYMVSGGVHAERKGLQNLMTGIFNEDNYPGKKIFYSENEYNEYLMTQGLQSSGGGGNYSKNVIFELNQRDFEKSLENVLKHIRAKSDDYERRKSPNKEGIVKNLFNKYFGKK